MLKRPKVDDIYDVTKDLVKEYEKNPKDFNDWERDFIESMKDQVLFFEMAKGLTNKQVKALYRTYYYKVENDPTAFDEWVEAYGFENI